MTLRYITAIFIICCFMKRAAALEQPNVGATATTVKDAETMTEAAPNAEEAEKLAVIKAEEARPKMEELKAPTKAVKDAEEAAEAAHKAKEDKGEESAVIQAEEDCPKAEAGERAAAKEIGVVRRFEAIMA